MKLGVHIGYWGLGLTARRPARDRPGGGEARLRLGLDGRGVRVGRGDDPRLAGAGDVDDPARLGDLPDARPVGGDDRDDRGDDRPALGRADDPRDRLVRAAGRRGLARPALRPPAPAHARVRRGRADGARARARRVRGRDARAAAAGRPGQAAEADDRARCRSRSRSTSPRSGRRTRTLAAEIADGWIPTLFSPEHVAEFRPLLEEGFARAGNGKGFDDFDIAPTVQRDDHRRPRRRRATRCARTWRCTSAGWARATRTSTTRWCAGTGSRTRRRRCRTCTWRASATRPPRRCPEELIDTVSLCGPPDHVRDRLAVFRDAGVGTLMVSPMAWTFEDRLQQLRLVAELAA